jgi:hypothetical protein
MPEPMSAILLRAISLFPLRSKFVRRRAEGHRPMPQSHSSKAKKWQTIIFEQGISIV